MYSRLRFALLTLTNIIQIQETLSRFSKDAVYKDEGFPPHALVSRMPARVTRGHAAHCCRENNEILTGAQIQGIFEPTFSNDPREEAVSENCASCGQGIIAIARFSRNVAQKFCNASRADDENVGSFADRFVKRSNRSAFLRSRPMREALPVEEKVWKSRWIALKKRLGFFLVLDREDPAREGEGNRIKTAVTELRRRDTSDSPLSLPPPCPIDNDLRSGNRN